MPPVEAYGVNLAQQSWNPSRCWWGPWFMLGWISQENLGRTEHVGLALPTSEALGGYTYLNTKSCATGQPSWLRQPSPQPEWAMTVFCQVGFQLAQVPQPCSRTSSLVGTREGIPMRCGGTPVHPSKTTGGPTHPRHHHYCKAQEVPALLVLRQLKSTHRKDRFSLILSDFFSSLMSLIDFLSLWLRAWITKFPLSLKVQDTSEILRRCN